jgi:hypothetical protein
MKRSQSILRASGDFARAAKFLDLEAKANLLPEERQLIEKGAAYNREALAFSLSITRVPRGKIDS